jgi:hypothetical protein
MFETKLGAKDEVLLVSSQHLARRVPKQHDSARQCLSVRKPEHLHKIVPGTSVGLGRLDVFSQETPPTTCDVAGFRLLAAV